MGPCLHQPGRINCQLVKCNGLSPGAGYREPYTHSQLGFGPLDAKGADTLGDPQTSVGDVI